MTSRPTSHRIARLYFGDQLVDRWTAANDIPTPKIDAHSSSERRVTGIALRTGDQIRIEGVPDSAERAALDYLEIEPAWTPVID